MSETTGGAKRRPEPGFGEFVGIIALTMGLISLSIDNLLPAFAPIRADYGIADANELQLILSTYMVGFGVMQLFYGPLSDVIGRRPALMIGLVVYSLGAVLALLADSFTVLLVARTIQGMGAASMRVLTVAIVRDRYEGRDMARVMSFVLMIFIIVPIFAPATGSAILLLGSWHLIFVSMLALALVVAIWFGLRMPETLHPEYRLPFSMKRIGQGLWRVMTLRVAIGYATVMGLLMGCLMSYLNSSQQIFETEVYGLGPLFPVVFGCIAAAMGVASFLNAKLVRRLGMRRLAHTGIVGFTAVAALQLVLSLAYGGHPPLIAFAIVLAVNQFLFSLSFPNVNAMAMERLGAIAGTAASFIGFYTTLLGTAIGLVVGQVFDGTVIPMGIAYLVLGLLSVGVVLWTEKGRLFHPTHPDPKKA